MYFVVVWFVHSLSVLIRWGKDTIIYDINMRKYEKVEDVEMEKYNGTIIL